MEIFDKETSLLTILGSLSVIVTPRRQKAIDQQEFRSFYFWCPFRCGERVTTHPRSGTERNLHRGCLKSTVFSSVSSFCPSPVNNGKLRSLLRLRICRAV